MVEATRKPRSPGVSEFMRPADSTANISRSRFSRCALSASSAAVQWSRSRSASSSTRRDSVACPNFVVTGGPVKFFAQLFRASSCTACFTLVTSGPAPSPS